MAPRFEDKFRLAHRQEGEKHILTIIPHFKCDGFPPKDIEITEGQWNDIRFHFGVGTAKGTDEQVVYVV